MGYEASDERNRMCEGAYMSAASDPRDFRCKLTWVGRHVGFASSSVDLLQGVDALAIGADVIHKVHGCRMRVAGRSGVENLELSVSWATGLLRRRSERVGVGRMGVTLR